VIKEWASASVSLAKFEPTDAAGGIRLSLLPVHTLRGLNKTKHGPLRIEHGRYINFISDFMAASKKGSREEAVKAWQELKAMDAPKTYESWGKARKRHKGRV
jgi:hypothetical protein